MDGTEAEGLAPDGELELAAAGGGLVVEEGVKLGDKEVVGDAGEENGDEGLEGDEGLDGVVATVVDGAGGGVEVVGELMGRAKDVVDELVEVSGGEGVGIVTGASGVEVAGRGAGAPGSQLGITMRAAVGVAAHGPVAATGDLAAGFERISGHGFWLLSSVKMTVGTFEGTLTGWHV
jgi:hypothetical protein